MGVMNEPHPSKKPYKTLGTHLKYLREQSNQTIAEVSGSVEIEDAALERIEAGLECPSEDILLLLINHFNMRDQEATQLWELAGYGPRIEEKAPANDDNTIHKQVVMLLALDTRTVYSDGVVLDSNRAGVTISFTQSSAQPTPTVVARLGMSHEQAQQVVRTLQTALLQAKFGTGPKALPPSTTSGDAADTAK